MSVQAESVQVRRERSAQEGPWPFVSVIMPVLNEERFIAGCLEAALQQDYPADSFEIIVADGMSTDRTREIIQALQSRHPTLRLIDNPGRIVPTGLNRALQFARGEIVVRFDGHCEYPRDYIRRVVELREQTDADNAGGALVPVGQRYISQAVAAAYYSPVGLGSALKGHATGHSIREVDAVHGGCWRRRRLLEIGMFDEEMVRNQDDELSFRLRKAAGRIVQSSSIRVKYSVRESFRKLFLQFAQYGYWKVRVVAKHPRQASLRHFIPAAFLLTLGALAMLAPVLSMALWSFCGLAGSYLSALSLAALYQALRSRLTLWPGITLALLTMHLGYGLGFTVGWLRRLVGPLPTDRIFERVTR
jgi:succinoglycan biosynthesis protein ExoA